MISIADDLPALAEAVAHAVAGLIGEGGSIALSGGSTPRPAYERLASRPIAWDRVRVFFGDERCVPEHDPRSNLRLARETLLDRVPLPAANLFPMRCTGDADAAAQAYERTLRAQLGDPPRLGVVLLGLGEDGHTASLIPGNDAALAEATRLTAVTRRPDEDFVRLTLTFPALDAAEHVLFMVSGEGKARVLAEVLAGDVRHPATRVRPSRQVHWLVDRAAARALHGS